MCEYDSCEANSFEAFLIADAWLRWILLASPHELLEHVLGAHTTATEPCSLIHHLEQRVLGFLADDHYALHVNQQLAALKFRLGVRPYRSPLRHPRCD